MSVRDIPSPDIAADHPSPGMDLESQEDEADRHDRPGRSVVVRPESANSNVHGRVRLLASPQRRSGRRRSSRWLRRKRDEAGQLCCASRVFVGVDLAACESHPQSLHRGITRRARRRHRTVARVRTMQECPDQHGDRSSDHQQEEQPEPGMVPTAGVHTRAELLRDASNSVHDAILAVEAESWLRRRDLTVTARA